MPNVLVVSFTCLFNSDGSNLLVADLSVGPVDFGQGETGLLVPSAKFATGFSNLFSSTGTIDSASLNKGILTINYLVAPNVGQQEISGILEF